MSYKLKSKKVDIENWLKICEDFQNQINKIEQERKLIIKINKNCNSIYFKKNNVNYRISLHNKINKNEVQDLSNDYYKWNGGLENYKNIVTNSRKNIIKKLEQLL